MRVERRCDRELGRAGGRSNNGRGWVPVVLLAGAMTVAPHSAAQGVPGDGDDETEVTGAVTPVDFNRPTRSLIGFAEGSSDPVVYQITPDTEWGVFPPDPIFPTDPIHVCTWRYWAWNFVASQSYLPKALQRFLLLQNLDNAVDDGCMLEVSRQELGVTGPHDITSLAIMYEPL